MKQISPVTPVLPIRNVVIFPSTSMPLVVGRGKSIKALETAEATDQMLLVVSQRILTQSDPQPTDLYSIGTLCKIENLTTGDSGSRQVVVTGVARYKVEKYSFHADGYLTAVGEVIPDSHSDDVVRNQALFFNLKELSREILELLPGATEPLVQLIDKVEDAGYLTNICAAYLSLTLSQKQALLEEPIIEDRMEILLGYMRKEREVLSLQREIRDKMSERLNKAQREALLREQLRTIRTELGEESGEDASDDLTEKLRQAKLPEEASRQANEELKRLRGLPPNSAEYQVIRTYLEWMASLPWSKKTPSNIDLVRAREILDEDHYGLGKVKKRIVQFLAVAKLKNDLHGPILCLVGPPGVGKTSLGQSIARALDRKFIRASLGGVRDEAEIRGHRRTYVGAMPGRIIQSIKRAGTRNPVMMLDEIDKLRADFQGDPSAAMLEVLDPEQNRSFTDHYLDVPFDLSDVFFICTANIVDTIPPALRDRMELIEVNGYTLDEKLEIARRYIIPRQIREHGLRPEWISLSDSLIQQVISQYTREAGVRELQRMIAAIFRSTAEEVVTQMDRSPEGTPPLVQVQLNPEKLKEILGPMRFYSEMAERADKPGIATGLAWTPHGGDILFVESTVMPQGKGSLILTGQLGDVMKESAQIALSLARSWAGKFHPFNFSSSDIHIHVPAGAIPKDGPSAGITILISLISLLMNRPIDLAVAMTGEITLRGAVLPVGGIKEKLLAAQRAGLKTILIPKRNEQDLADLPKTVLEKLDIHLIETTDDVIHELLEKPLTAIPEIAVPRAA